jgi:uncharacterized protein YqeY
MGEVRMSLRERLSDDLKTAMKSRDQLRVDVIRMIKAAVLNKEVEIKKDLDDAEMSRVMNTLIKQRKESVEQFEKGKRDDLADKERREILIIEGYLPRPVSAEDHRDRITRIDRDITERHGPDHEDRDGSSGRPNRRREIRKRSGQSQAPIIILFNCYTLLTRFGRPVTTHEPRHR